MGESFLRSRLIVRQSLDAIATVVLVVLTVYLGSFLSDILTLSISQWQPVKVPNFSKILLRSRPTIRQILDAIAIVILKIFIVYLGSFLSDLLTLSISQQQTFKLPNSREILLRSRPTVRQNFNALATVVLEILTVHLGPFLGYLLTLSISQWQIVKLPNLGQSLLRSRPTITQNLEDLITSFGDIERSFRVILGDFLHLNISHWQTVEVSNLGESFLRSKLLCLKLNSNASP